MKMENIDSSEKKNIPKNSIRDRINFFSNKAKEKQISKTSHTASNSTQVRRSCVINSNFLEKINQNIHNQKKKEQNLNITLLIPIY